MNKVTLALAILGMTGFAFGAVLSATGQLELGVFLMGMSLVFQVISLMRLRNARKEGSGNARR